jgi:hypothetical protein
VARRGLATRVWAMMAGASAASTPSRFHCVGDRAPQTAQWARLTFRPLRGFRSSPGGRSFRLPAGAAIAPTGGRCARRWKFGGSIRARREWIAGGSRSPNQGCVGLGCNRPSLAPRLPRRAPEAAGAQGRGRCDWDSRDACSVVFWEVRVGPTARGGGTALRASHRGWAIAESESPVARTLA